MANITIARKGEMLRVLFATLMKHPDGLPALDAIDAVRGAMELTPFEKGIYGSGGQRFERILRWATVDCVKAGWLAKEDGRWAITDKGIAAFEQYPDPAALYGEAIRLYRQWKKGQPADPEPDESELAGETPSAQGAEITLDAARDQARDVIEKYLHAMDPWKVQELVGALLRGMGYHVAWISPRGKDDGIDIVAYHDPLGTRPPRIKVQVKRYEKPVPVGDVSAFMGNLGSEEVGIFVSTGGFTKDAEAKARTDKQHRVTLIGLDDFVKLWVKHYAEIEERDRRRLPLQPVYFLALEA